MFSFAFLQILLHCRCRPQTGQSNKNIYKKYPGNKITPESDDAP